MHNVRWCWLFLFSLLAGCQSQSPVNVLPDVSQTLEAAGRRLSGSLSEVKLTTLSSRASDILRVLDRTERDVLSRGYLRISN